MNAISLEPHPQLTSNLKFVFILSRGQTLYILGHLLKTRWPPSNFLCYMDKPCERDILRIISPIDLKFDL